MGLYDWGSESMIDNTDRVGWVLAAISHATEAPRWSGEGRTSGIGV
jgi:hypothetical protein